MKFITTLALSFSISSVFFLHLSLTDLKISYQEQTRILNQLRMEKENTNRAIDIAQELLDDLDLCTESLIDMTSTLDWCLDTCYMRMEKPLVA